MTTNGHIKTAAAAARYYLLDGRQTVPLARHGKKPWSFARNRPLDGWDRLTLSDDSIDALFPEQANIGIRLGAASGGLVDVDLDCPEARRAAAVLLPDTGMIGGRASATDSHRFYTVDHPPDRAAEEFRDPVNGSLMLELRSTGGQTVVAPSVYGADPTKGHTRPEPFVWERDQPAARIRADVLRTELWGVAAAALLGRYWERSRRHAAALALAGGLCRAGVPVARAERFMRAVCAAAGDEEVDNRIGCVRSTYEKGSDDHLVGWPRLAELLGAPGPRVVSAVTEWLGISLNPIRPPVVFGCVSDWKPPAPLPEMPAVPAFPIGAFPPAVADYWTDAAESLGWPVDFVAVPALPLLGAAAGRSIAVELKRTYKEPPLLWCGLVAPPGAAKSPALTFAQGALPLIAARWAGDHKRAVKEYRIQKLRYEEELRAWKRSGCPGDGPAEEPECPTVRQLVYNNFTVETLIRGNHANPRGVAVCKDELSGLVSALNQYKAGKGDDRQNLLSMWAGAGITFNRESDRKAGLPPLTMPHTFLAVSGMIQPDLLATFRGDVGREHAANDGWADRFLLSFPDPPPARGENWKTVSEQRERSYAGVFEALLSWELIPVRDEAGNVVTHRPCYVPFDGAAERVWEGFTADVAERMNALDPFDSYRGVLSKSRHHTLRLAAAVHAIRRACGEIADTAPVTAATMQRAVQLMAYFEAHGKRCLGVGWLDQPCRVAKRLLDWLARNPAIASFTRSDAFIQLKDGKDVRTSALLDRPFRLLMDLNYIRPLLAPGTRPGPVAEAYQINPAWDRKPHEPIPKVPNIELPSDRQQFNIRDFRDGFSPEPAPDSPGKVPHTLITSAAGIGTLTEALTGWAGPIGLDTETTGLDPRTARVRLIQIAAGEDVAVIDVFALPAPRADLAPLFAALAGKEIIGHNLQFDLRMLSPLGFVPGSVFDTMLSSRVLYAGRRDTTGARFKHGLGDVVARELGRELDKGQQKADWSGPLTPAQIRYAEADAAVLLPLAAALKEKLAAAGLSAIAETEMRALPGIAWAVPITVDVPAWRALADLAESERQRLADEMDTLAPNPAGLPGMETRNWDSPQQVLEAFTQVGVSVEATDDDTLAGVSHPLAAKLREYRACAKRVGTYGRAWIEAHAAGGAVLASWNQLGAESGRMSCSNPNLQQIPRGSEYRRCFVARPGCVLVKADYSQIELRIAAKVANEPVMIAAYKDGRDLHTLTAARVLGKPEADVTKSDRQLAKAVNFGLLYGMGWKSLKGYAKANYGVTLTDAQARNYREAFFRAYPALRRWHSRVGADVTARFETDPTCTHEVRTLGGRRRVLPVAKRSADGSLYANKQDALNTPVQGTGADGLKAAIALLWERRAQCPAAVPVLFCHDEIVLEVPEPDAERAAEWLRACMVDAVAPLLAPVPLEVEGTVGRSWGG